MGFLDRIRDKTVADVVDTAKEKVSDTMKAAAEDKTRTILTILPLAVTALIVFHGSDSGMNKRDIPTKTIINNYYYGEKKVKPDAADHH